MASFSLIPNRRTLGLRATKQKFTDWVSIAKPIKSSPRSADSRPSTQRSLLIGTLNGRSNAGTDSVARISQSIPVIKMMTRDVVLLAAFFM
jgi:hypothetical protein